MARRGHIQPQQKYRRKQPEQQGKKGQQTVISSSTSSASGGSRGTNHPASVRTVPSTDRVGMQTLQQQRARYALEAVQTAIANEQVNKKEFRSYASSFPAMIQMNGLGQAAAFYFSQGGTYKALYDILSGWLVCSAQPYGNDSDLLAGITRRDMTTYRVTQAESLLLLDWVKKFAKAYVRED